MPSSGRRRPSSVAIAVVLPAPFGPEERHHLALAHGERDGIEGRDTAEPLGHPIELGRDQRTSSPARLDLLPKREQAEVVGEVRGDARAERACREVQAAEHEPGSEVQAGPGAMGEREAEGAAGKGGDGARVEELTEDRTPPEDLLVGGGERKDEAPRSRIGNECR